MARRELAHVKHTASRHPCRSQRQHSLSHFAALDIPVSGAETRKLLGWESTGPSLLDDLEQDHYYRSGADVG